MGNMEATFEFPTNIVYSPLTRSYYINGESYIRQFTPAAQAVTTPFGSSATSITDGVGTNMRFIKIKIMISDHTGNALFVLDSGAIRRINLTSGASASLR